MTVSHLTASLWKNYTTVKAWDNFGHGYGVPEHHIEIVKFNINKILSGCFKIYTLSSTRNKLILLIHL